jgi:methyl-accepting chemotaxis protein
MFGFLSKGTEIPESHTTVDRNELEALRQKAQAFEDMVANNCQSLASNIVDHVTQTNNANNERLSVIERNAQDIEHFIEHSSSIESASEQSFHAASETAQTSESCISQIQDLTNNISTSAQFINDFTNLLSRLDENSKNIEQMVEAIKGIADQTNLLALNAAIEAARAGEHGRGFAVVADEVRSLANTANESADKIQSEMKNITDISESIIIKQKEVKDLIDTSVEIANTTNAKLNELVNAARNSAGTTENIVQQIRDQLSNSDSIKSNMQSLIEETRVAINGSGNTLDLAKQLSQAINK